jgi:hypothetical protein
MEEANGGAEKTGGQFEGARELGERADSFGESKKIRQLEGD